MENKSKQSVVLNDQIRNRPGMYIGDFGLTGFKNMLRNLFEEILNDCFENPIFEIIFFQNNKITIKIVNIDNEKFILRLEEFKKPNIGFFNLGLGVLIALSSDISIGFNGLKSFVVLTGKKGEFKIVTTVLNENQSDVVISFSIDKDIFKNFEFDYEQINSFLYQFAILNPNLKIISEDKTDNELQRIIFHYPTGVFNELDFFISQQDYSKPYFRIDIEAIINNYSYKIGISYSRTNLDKYYIKTYAGNTETYAGGSLNNGILGGIILAIKTIAQKENIEIKINRKLLKNQLIVIAAVRGEDLVFEGSIKSKLGMPKLQKDVRKLVSEEIIKYLENTPKSKGAILANFTRWEDF